MASIAVTNILQKSTYKIEYGVYVVKKVEFYRPAL